MRSSCRLVALLALASACRSGSAASQTRAGSGAEGRSAAEDTAIFEAVVREVARGLKLPWQVDPRPLRADPAVVEVTAATRTAITRPASEARVAALRVLGVSEVDIAALPPCAGVLVPPDADGAAHRGCPKALGAVVGIGLPRTGSPAVPAGALGPLGPAGDSTAKLPPNQRSVRVLVTERGPGGSATTVYDYVVEPGRAGWRVVRTVALLDIE